MPTAHWRLTKAEALRCLVLRYLLLQRTTRLAKADAASAVGLLQCGSSYKARLPLLHRLLLLGRRMLSVSHSPTGWPAMPLKSRWEAPHPTRRHCLCRLPYMLLLLLLQRLLRLRRYLLCRQTLCRRLQWQVLRLLLLLLLLLLR